MEPNTEVIELRAKIKNLEEKFDAAWLGIAEVLQQFSGFHLATAERFDDQVKVNTVIDERLAALEKKPPAEMYKPMPN